MNNLFGILIIFVTINFELRVDAFKPLNRLPRHNAKINTFRWTNAAIPYRIDMTNYTLNHVQKLKNAMKIIENSTCIKFIEKTHEKDFVTITGNSYHCGTKIGRRGGEQILSILNNESCFRTSSILHEFLHILGFHHMHLSGNRDEFVKIVWKNIKPEKWRKFRIRDNLQDLDVEYDYESIMHYSEYAHTKNGKKTMIPLSAVSIGQRESLSEKDILKIKRLYDCDEINEIQKDQ